MPSKDESEANVDEAELNSTMPFKLLAIGLMRDIGYQNGVRYVYFPADTILYTDITILYIAIQPISLEIHIIWKMML